MLAPNRLPVPENFGLGRTIRRTTIIFSGMSAIHPKADIVGGKGDVRFVPI